MGIIYIDDLKEFHLYNSEISYIIGILPNGHIGQLYFGKRIHGQNFSHLLELGFRDMAPCTFEGDSYFSLEHIKQEYPSYGSGDLRYPAFEIEQENGSRLTDFRYLSHRIYQGKPTIKGLPSTYIEKEEEATTLEITLEDSVIRTQLVLKYTIYEELTVISRSASFYCNLEEGVYLTAAASLCLDLPDCNYDMVDFTGAWGRERYLDRHKLHYGVQEIFSLRGHSSHQFNPLMILARPDTSETEGEAIGISLVYSGNFQGSVSVDTMEVTRVLLGIHPMGFRWPLMAGEEFHTPEALLVYTKKGFNNLSKSFHTLFRTRLAKGYWRDKVRPILINNWEATYLDFDEDKILNLAETAKRLGIELFVLDDGWFGERNDVKSSLGDWYPNMAKLPHGLTGLADKITGMGLKFGLWFEPEMISKNSRLYSEHPDWILGSTERTLCHGRNQYVLDFSKTEVVTYIGDVMADILRETAIAYVKWDMNRSLSDVYSTGTKAGYQGTVVHKHMLGIYALYDRLTTEFPTVLFESCASGGARFDPGMLSYAPQGWTSDNTDAVERLKIQYGTSYAYPLSCMGSHVSAVPNHQTFRMTPLSTRAGTAYFGTFGYELDLTKLSTEEQEIIKQQIEFMKKYRELIFFGNFYRLLSPFEGNETAWMVIAEDGKQAIVGYYRILQPVNSGFKRLKLQGLKENTEYRISDRNYSCYGDELMNVGLILSDGASGVVLKDVPQGDYLSRLFLLEAL
jgi:alpha-galactosidase